MKVLFLCTANSCRSILCEAAFNHLAPEGMRAFSAGSFPKNFVHPLAIKALERVGIPVDGLSSKSSDVHADLLPDFVITVCDKAAGEACPVYFGAAVRAHWGLADPSEIKASDVDVDFAFDATLQQIRARMLAFFALPFDQLREESLRAELGRIGRL